ncbi:hypothetical protein ACV36C_34895, partial [Pseudomonas aeruginosa]
MAAPAKAAGQASATHTVNAEAASTRDAEPRCAARGCPWTEGLCRSPPKNDRAFIASPSRFAPILALAPR